MAKWIWRQLIDNGSKDKQYLQVLQLIKENENGVCSSTKADQNTSINRRNKDDEFESYDSGVEDALPAEHKSASKSSFDLQKHTDDNQHGTKDDQYMILESWNKLSSKTWGCHSVPFINRFARKLTKAEQFALVNLNAREQFVFCKLVKNMQFS